MPDSCTEILVPTLYKPRDLPARYIEKQAEFDSYIIEFTQSHYMLDHSAPSHPKKFDAQNKPRIAIDTERSRGKDYQAHVELLQLKIDEEPIILIDAQHITGIDALAPHLAQFTWIAHAAEADLLALHKLGLQCTSLFDTELAGRFLGYTHVNLATMTRECLAINLDKGKGGEDWSLRPIAPELLLYAALDVELLAELADVLNDKLIQSNKLGWFQEECHHIIHNLSPTKRKFNWKKITKNYRNTHPNFKQTFTVIWHIREYFAYNLDIFPQLLASDETLLSWAALHQEIQWENLNQSTLIDLIFPVFSDEKLSDFLPLDENFWQEITHLNSSTHPDFLYHLELIQERKKTITAVTREIAYSYTLDPIVLSSRTFSNALAKDITLYAESEIQRLMRKLGSRTWQINILSAALSEELSSLAIE